MSMQINPIPTGQESQLASGQKAVAAPGFESLILTDSSLKSEQGEVATLSHGIQDNKAQADTMPGQQKPMVIDAQVLLMPLQQQGQMTVNGEIQQPGSTPVPQDNGINWQHLWISQKLPEPVNVQTLEYAGVKPQLMNMEDVLAPQLMLTFAQTEPVEPVEPAEPVESIEQADATLMQGQAIGVTILMSSQPQAPATEQNATVHDLAVGAMLQAALPTQSTAVVNVHNSVMLEQMTSQTVQPHDKIDNQTLRQLFEHFPEQLNIKVQSDTGGQESTGQKVTMQLVQWSAVATGKLSHVYSINPAVEAVSMTTRAIDGVEHKMPAFQPLSPTQSTEKPQLALSQVANQAQLGQSVQNKKSDTEQRQAISAAKQHGALFQNLILPQKVTWSEQLQKLWVRDYFLSSQQTEQLLQQVKNGFEHHGQVKTLVLNGHTVYQAGGKR